MVAMEGDKIEMIREELQRICEQIKDSELVSQDLLKKYLLLQTVLEKKEKQAASILKLCESVAKYEAIVKKQYSMLGWEYRDTDSEEDEDITDNGNASESSCKNLNEDQSEKQIHHLKQPVVVLMRLPECKIRGLSSPSPENKNNEDEVSNISSGSDGVWEPDEQESSDSDYFPSGSEKGGKKRKKSYQKNGKGAKRDASPTPPTRSPMPPTGSPTPPTRSPTPPTGSPTASTRSSMPPARSSTPPTGSPMPPTRSPMPPTGSPTRSSTLPTRSSTLLTRSSTLPTRSSTPPTRSSAAPTRSSTPPTRSSTPPTRSSAAPTRSSAAPTRFSAAPTRFSMPPTMAPTRSSTAPTRFSMPPTMAPTRSSTAPTRSSTAPTRSSNQKASSKTNPLDGRKTQNVPSGTKSTESARSHDRPAKALAVLPEVTVGMTVLARKKAMRWYHGEIVEIINKENGSVKYKVVFEKDLGKVLVSGHHIAFDLMLKLDHLPELSRVLVRPPGDPWFCPGVLAERPGRRNRMRFLVFLDNHVPIYVSLPLIRLVCKPLPNPWDDISDEMQKNFIEQHTKWLPNPPLTQCVVGQKMNAMFNGVQQKCNVVQIDFNLVEVLFMEDQHKEWLYRGSPRLEHIINMTKHLQSNESKQNNKK